MTEPLDLARPRWDEAAALLAGVGRVPSALVGWLGPAWSGSAALAYQEWAALLERATRLAAAALRDAADRLRAPAVRPPHPPQRPDLSGMEAGCRGIRDVPVPGERAGSDRHRAGHSGGPPPQRDPERRPGQPPPDKPATATPAGPSTARQHDQLAGWISQAVDILRQHGYHPDQIDPGAIATIIQHESGGDPKAVNDWDANAARGTPSMGLMQTIGPTFDRWHLPGHDEILDPVDNIIAGVRYAVARYGSVSQVPGLRSLAAGEAYRGY